MALNVTVPTPRSDIPRGTEVRPRKVEIWLASLPQANAEDTAKHLYQAVFTQNRTPLEPENRLSLMELYRAPILEVTRSLAQSYVSGCFPLLPRQRAVVEAVDQLLVEMANGYKLTANDLINQGGLENQTTEVVLALQRAIFSAGRVLLNAYQAYTARAGGVWRELHQLYQYAETQELLHYPVPAAVHAEYRDDLVTVCESYQQILLLGACTPYSLLQGECEYLYQLIPRWLNKLSITRKVRTKHPFGRFLISLNADSPPVPLTKASDSVAKEHVRVLNAIEVARDVHAVLKGYHGTSPHALRAVIPGIDASQMDLLRRFGRVLGGANLTRRSMRTPGDREISICVGMSAIHYYANGQKKFEPPQEPDQPDAEEAEEYIDVASPDLGAGRGPGARDPASAPARNWYGHVSYKHHACEVRDESANGLCVCVSIPSDLRARVGDPIGLLNPDSDRWRVGAIRWIRGVSAERIDMGVQMLAPAICPVAVKRVARHKHEEMPFVQALLLPGNPTLDQPESVLIPRGTYQAGEKMLLCRPHSAPMPISPSQLLERTGSYDQLRL